MKLKSSTTPVSLQRWVKRAIWCKASSGFPLNSVKADTRALRWSVRSVAPRVLLKVLVLINGMRGFVQRLD
jgi:hypothetical protein